ncbi:LysR substrate-binding domain-containing protein [Stappia sp.]|uniref:LysR substrate-binding domain-containing protein n=1 Tax=Stappia sp. TaxID=1870903 RepID=UPI0032D98AC1
MVSISQLKAFEAVARTGSFTRAARELGVSQPSVSTQLRALESECAARLFLRDGHTLTLSRIGRALLPKARTVLLGLSDIDALLRDERGLETGHLRIGFSTHQYAMPLIADFMRRFPKISVETRMLGSLEIVQRLENGEIDAACITAKHPPKSCDAVFLRKDRVVAVTARDHPLAGRDTVTWRDLAGYPILQREKTSGTRQIIDEALAEAGLHLEVALELLSSEPVVSAASAGIGIGMALDGEFQDYGRLGPDAAFRLLRVEAPALTCNHYLVTLKGMREIGVIRALFEGVAEGVAVAADDGPAIPHKV